MNSRNAVETGIDRFGKESGFEKKSGSWYRRRKEIVEVLDLQKSQYGPLYYLNVSFSLRRLGVDDRPMAHQSHIVARAEGLAPAIEPRLALLLNLEYEIDEDVRELELVSLLREHISPLLEQAESEIGLRTMADAGALDSAGIVVTAQKALGLRHQDSKGA